MHSFSEFYFNGGIYMHLVTVGLGLAATCFVFARRAEQRERWLATGTRALFLCLAVGLLGTIFGIVEVGEAVAGCQVEEAAKAATRGFGLAVHPFSWALLGTLPLFIHSAIVRHRIS